MPSILRLLRICSATPPMPAFRAEARLHVTCYTIGLKESDMSDTPVIGPFPASRRNAASAGRSHATGPRVSPPATITQTSARWLMTRWARFPDARITRGRAVQLVAVAGNRGRHTGVQRQPFAADDLTQAERRVLRYLPTHLTAREIADELYVSLNTVRTHIRHIYAKLGANRRGDAVDAARAVGLLKPSREIRSRTAETVGAARVAQKLVPLAEAA